ncbi:MAG TPA: hypothetical protein PLQ12_11600, partial [Candidatus Defluviicoccus seviourii]|nr:hypothetical protein [Candidatus Defluviicoccus seviourii]
VGPSVTLTRRLAGVVPTAHTPARGVERPFARIRELLDRVVHVLGRGDPQMVDEDRGAAYLIVAALSSRI